MARLGVNGTSLEYAERGNGPTVVLVHGSTSDYRTWDKQMGEFSSDYRVVAYSRRYHWPNEPIPEGADYSMPEHVDDLAAVLRGLGVGPVHLVGHSYGAFLCLLLAIREPQLIRSLVLAEPPVVTLFVSNDPKPRELLRLLLQRPRAAVAIMKFAARGLLPATRAAREGDVERAIRSFGMEILGRDAFEALSDERMGQVRDNFIAAELTGSGFPPVEEEGVRGVRIPTLLIRAQKSPAMFHLLVERLAELLPEASVVEIDGASHIMHEDNPAEYNSAVKAFWAGSSSERDQ